MNANQRTRVAAVVVSGGKVLLQHAKGDTFWALPGGQVERDEKAAEALARELLEELGEPFSVGAQLWALHHTFEHKGTSVEEHGVYYAATPRSSTFLEKAGPFTGVEPDRGLMFDWFDVNELIRVDCRPAVVRDKLAQVLKPPWT